MKARRVAKILAMVSALLPLLLAGLLAWLLFSNSALQLFWAAARAHVDGLQASAVKGRLWGPLELSDLRWRNAQWEVAVKHTRLNWRLDQLLTSELQISELTAQGVAVYQLASTGPEKNQQATPTLPERLPLPINIHVTQASIQDVSFTSRNADEPLQLNTIRLAGGLTSDRLTVQQLLIDSQHYAVSGRLQTVFPKNYQSDAELKWRLNLPEVAEGKGSLQANGNLESLALRLSGTFDPKPSEALTMGSVKLTADADAGLQGIDVHNLSLQGSLQDRPLDLQASFSFDGSTANVHDLALISGASQLNATGQIGERVAFQWSLRSADLNDVHPQAGGSIQGQGTATGVWPWLDVQAELQARSLHWNDVSLAELKADANIALQSGTPSQLELYGEQLKYGNKEIHQLQLLADGTAEDHTASLQLDSQLGSAELALTGHYAQGTWRANLQEGLINPDRLSAWTLQGEQLLLIEKEQLTLQRACWDDKTATLCLSAKKGREQTQAELSLDNFSLQTIAPLFTDSLQLQGVLSGGAQFTSGQTGTWQAMLTVDNEPISIRRPTDSAPLELLNLQAGQLTVEANQEQLQGMINIPTADGGGIKGRVGIVAGAEGLANGKVSGEFTANILDIAVLAALAPQIKDVQGELTANLKLTGNLPQLQPVGSLQIRGGQLRLSEPELLIDQLQLQAEASAGETFQLTASARSGGGNLQLSGAGKFAEQGLQLQSNLAGDNIQVWNSSDAQVWISPDLSASIDKHRVVIRGTIDIPRADITPQQLPKNAVRVSADQVIVAADADPQKTPQADMQSDVAIRLTLGDAVTVNGFGFSGRVAGGLNIKQTSAKPVVASGELNVVDGEYRAYGQGLVIDKGQFLFAGGAIDNPGINIRALRRPAENIVVGVHARGELREPQLSVFSQPAMSQSDQLSWLVLGRPLQAASDSETNYINQAALALGVRGGNYLTKGLGEKLGVDSIGIETGSGEAGAASDVNQAALVIGKYLTPDLYISYGIGLLDSLSTVKLRYLITDQWNLVTESSAESSGGDLSYSFER